jgi:creatinine amidohydrolase
VPDVLLPLGAVEKHGPHLPLDTDTRLAVALAHRVAPRLGAEVAPAFTGTAASYAADFEGTVHVPPDQEQRALVEAVLGILDRGAARVVLVNLHFDPAHMGAIEGALVEVEAKDPGRARFPDFTRRRHAQRIGGEFATGACHAGEFETSLLLAIAPEAVQPFAHLPPRMVDLAQAIRAGKRSFREVGLEQAYCGHPATATRGEGERLLAVLADIVVDEVTPTGAASTPR